MAGVLASGIVQGVLLKLGSVLLETMWQSGFFDLKGGIAYMKSKLATIMAVLADAEEKSIKDKPICIWLNKLKDVAYDIDDLLDEFQTEAIRPRQGSRKRMTDATKQFFSLSNPMIFRVTMSQKIKALKQRLDEIATERNQFHLSENGSSSRQIKAEKPETISMVDESKTIGRSHDKEAIMRLILDTTCEEDISVIPIVGMGGLGKTTLAQLVFHDKRANEEVFDPRIWVSVCNNFKLRTIVSPILAASKEQCDINSLEAVAGFLKRTFTGKKYLLVLDDVPDENQEEWERLKLLLKDGKKGSKIIITTRSRRVAMLMRTVPPYNLKGLSKDHCWEVFRQRAFEKGEDGKHPVLVRIGKEIVIKCGGVPLAAQALGRMLRFKREERDWNAIKDSEMWQLENEDQILPSLMLSFNQLPPDLKQCFAYCSIFPKNFEIEKEKLIQQWLALGFIESQREDKGSEYFDHLYWMSFVQDLEDNESAKYGFKYVLHHLVHDLARRVSGEEVRVISWPDQITPSHSCSCRYISFIENNGESLNNNQNEVLCSLSKKVRALHSRSAVPVSEMISQARFLRVLDLHGSQMKEIPEYFTHKWKHLRYFDISSSCIQTLPESIHEMTNLETLHLSNCSNLTMLPSSIGMLSNLKNLNLAACNFYILPESLGNLINLHSLDLSSCHNLNQLPNSISGLTKLQSLRLRSCDNLPILPQSICNLRNLNLLDLSRCGLLRELPKSFGNLSNLHSLNLSQCSDLKELPESIGILRELQKLDLSHCSHLLLLPESIDGLQALQTLNLSHISSASILPASLGRLVNLQELNLSWNFELKTLPDCIGSLLNLRTLTLFHCWNLQVLPNSITHLMNLEILSLVGCEKLEDLPKDMARMKNLRSLINVQCQSLRGIPLGFSQLSNLETLPLFIAGLQENNKYSTIADLGTLDLLTGDLNIVFHAYGKNIVEDARNARLSSKRKLQSLILTWSNNKNNNNNDSNNIIPQEEETEALLQVLVPPKNLENLYINGYVGGIFSSWMTKEYLPNLVSLKLINIPNCVSLPSLEYLPSLQSLELRHMDRLQNIGMDPLNDGEDIEISLYPSLRECYLENLPNLETWQTMVNINTNKSKKEKGLKVLMFPKLMVVLATKCPKMKPNPCLPPSILDLMVSDSSEILSSKGVYDLYSPSLLRRLWIINCGVLSNCWGALEYHEKLEDLTIENCKELRKLAESMRYLKSIRRLKIDGCVNLESIPEWIGDLVTLESLEIFSCPNLDYLPLSMQCLTALEEITISGCSTSLEEACQKDSGEDWFKICHVPNIFILSKSSV